MARMQSTSRRVALVALLTLGLGFGAQLVVVRARGRRIRRNRARVRRRTRRSAHRTRALNAPIVGIAATRYRQGLLAPRERRRHLQLRQRRASTGRPAPCTSTSRSSGSRRRRAAAATGSSPPTAASSRFGDAALLRLDRRDAPQPADHRHGADAERPRLLARRDPTAASSRSGTRASTARPARRFSSPRSRAWRRRPAAAATGSPPPTGACSRSATRPRCTASRRRRRSSVCSRQPNGPGLWLVVERRRGLHDRDGARTPAARTGRRARSSRRSASHAPRREAATG